MASSQFSCLAQLTQTRRINEIHAPQHRIRRTIPRREPCLGPFNGAALISRPSTGSVSVPPFPARPRATTRLVNCSYSLD
ncbi:hypothetical protein IF1G_08019 [Cordyceps javanica]|uniref:Uncharacterized protein n=1 Tax=Cordyceps javanica TaxID=43265 RepID=A0A545UVF7_9HYPO|nr:hypothetical protein IF1G_08019 [Cordyceps javanica]